MARTDSVPTRPAHSATASHATAETRNRPRIPSSSTTLAITVCLLTMTFGSGCAAMLTPVALVARPIHGIHNHLAYNQCVDDVVRGWRNRHLAKKAWHARKHQLNCHPYTADFEQGFIDGYIEAANGGKGCLPVTPPRRYWGWRYASHQGQEQMNAWFEGFPYGAAAAEEDGVVFYGQIAVSDAITQQMEEHHPHAHFYNSQHWNAPGNQGLPDVVPHEVVPPGDPSIDLPGAYRAGTPYPDMGLPTPQNELRMPSISDDPAPMLPGPSPSDRPISEEPPVPVEDDEAAADNRSLRIMPVEAAINQAPYMPSFNPQPHIAQWGVYPSVVH